MYWSAVLVLALTGPNDQLMNVAHTPSKASFESYTQAWNAAKQAELPMLVILNAPAETTAAAAVTEEKLAQDATIQPLLGNYVVAVIDTSSAHGAEVHKLFGNKTLPQVVVIDKQQKKQIYQSNDVSNGSIARAMGQYKSGIYTPPVYTTPTLNWMPPAECKSCQRNFQF